MPRYLNVYITCILIFVFAAPAASELYQYRDKNGILRITNNIYAVPPEYRPQLEQYTESESATDQTEAAEAKNSSIIPDKNQEEETHIATDNVIPEAEKASSAPEKQDISRQPEEKPEGIVLEKSDQTEAAEAKNSSIIPDKNQEEETHIATDNVIPEAEKASFRSETTSESDSVQKIVFSKVKKQEIHAETPIVLPPSLNKPKPKAEKASSQLSDTQENTQNAEKIKDKKLAQQMVGRKLDRAVKPEDIQEKSVQKIESSQSMQKSRHIKIEKPSRQPERPSIEASQPEIAKQKIEPEPSADKQKTELKMPKTKKAGIGLEAREKQNLPVVSPSSSASENKPAPLTEKSSEMSESQKKRKLLDAKEAALNIKFKELIKEKQSIESSLDVKDKESVQKYNESVKNLNKKIKAYKKEKSILQEEIQKFEESLNREADQ